MPVPEPALCRVRGILQSSKSFGSLSVLNSVLPAVQAPDPFRKHLVLCRQLLTYTEQPDSGGQIFKQRPQKLTPMLKWKRSLLLTLS